MAANLLGLSTQVPAKSSYLTNTTARLRRVAGRTIQLKRARVALMSNISYHANLTLQALSNPGKNNIDNKILNRCALLALRIKIYLLYIVQWDIFRPGWRIRFIKFRM